MDEQEVARRELAASLRRLRLASRLSTVTVADRLNWSQSKVSKIEFGRTRPSVQDVRALGRLLGATADEIKELEAAADLISRVRRSWRAVSAAGLAGRQEEIAALEDQATAYRTFVGGSIPGLLQTPEYAAATYRLLHGIDHKQIPAAVAARMRRQSVLYKSEKSFTFMLGEFAMRWLPDGVDDEAWAAQVDRVLTLGALSNVELLVLPERPAWRYLAGASVIIFDLAEAPLVVAEDGSTDSEYSAPELVAAYVDEFEQARARSLRGSQAEQWIRRSLP